METIQKIVDDHKSKMKRGTPQLNICDPAVMVSALSPTTFYRILTNIDEGLPLIQNEDESYYS